MNTKRWLVVSVILIIVIILIITLPLTIRRASNKNSNGLANASTTATTLLRFTTTNDNSSCGDHSCAALVVEFHTNLSTFWSFDSDTSDSFNNANATTVGNPTFYSSYGGTGTCIMFNGIDQYAVAPFVAFNNQSFTIELFAFLNIFSTDATISILSQCDSKNKINQCLTIGIVNAKLLFSFDGDELIGNTPLLVNQWYHFAFVFDIETLNQRIYLNGTLDGDRTAKSAYFGTSGNTIIGYNTELSMTYTFSGYMDNLAIYSDRAKSICEVNLDATLYAYYSWDNGLGTDDGPNRFDGDFYGLKSIESGYSKTGLQLSNTSVLSYFMASGFGIFGITNHSFSTSLWLKPSSYGGTIIFIAMTSSGTLSCHPIVGMTASGQPAAVLYDATQGLYSAISPDPILLNEWTHLVQTFSTTNGLRLYVNGTLKSSKIGYFAASAYQMKLFIGADGPDGITGCVPTTVQAQQYLGILDEVRIYSEELTQDDVCALFSS